MRKISIFVKQKLDRVFQMYVVVPLLNQFSPKKMFLR